MPLLSVIWYTAAIAGSIAAAGGLAHRAWRRQALLVAAMCFGVCGVLGILSIGLAFMVLAIGCLLLAERQAGSVA